MTLFIVTGADECSRVRFAEELQDRFQFTMDKLVVRPTRDLKDEGSAAKRYFLVMPSSSRYNVYIEGDESSMTKDIQLMCGGPPTGDSVKGAVSLDCRITDYHRHYKIRVLAINHMRSRKTSLILVTFCLSSGEV
jgi:hypothetical protein